MNNKPKLLYIDDEPINLYIFEINFNKHYNIVTGLSGFEGLDRLRANPDIKIVISDMSMPGMNGLEFIQKAKEEFREDISYFILTGYDITDEIKRALEENLLKKYFRKPLNSEEIRSSIQETICI